MSREQTHLLAFAKSAQDLLGRRGKPSQPPFEILHRWFRLTLGIKRDGLSAQEAEISRVVLANRDLGDLQGLSQQRVGLCKIALPPVVQGQIAHVCCPKGVSLSE